MKTITIRELMAHVVSFALSVLIFNMALQTERGVITALIASVFVYTMVYFTRWFWLLCLWLAIVFNILYLIYS